MAEIFEEVKDLIVDKWQVSPEDVEKGSRLDDLGLDSLDKIEFVMKLEEKYDVNIHDDLVEENHTVGDFVGLVVELSGGNRV